MNKQELITAVSIKGEMTKKQAEHAIETVFTVIEDALIDRQEVKLVGHGTYSVKRRETRGGINPQTKEKITIPAHDVAVWSPGKPLCDRIDDTFVG